MENSAVPDFFRLGLVGKNISSSMSPTIHNFSLKSLSLQGQYRLYEIEPLALAQFLKEFWLAGGMGLNITSPYKEKVAQILGSSLRSVNTLYRAETSFWSATSTDGAGLQAALSRIGCDLERMEHVIVLGSGGVVVCLLEYLQSFQPKQIVILRRDKSRDQILEGLRSHHQLRCVDFDATYLTQELKDKGRNTLLIQATSAPKYGNSLVGMASGLDHFHGFVYEMTYACESALFEKAKSLGISCDDGLSMLIEQARLSQKYWWKNPAPYLSIEDECRKILC